MCRRLPCPLALLLALSAAACTSSTTSPTAVTSTAVVPQRAGRAVVSADVLSFVMLELPYSNGWAYAPQVRLAVPSGGIGVTVTRMEFDIPGLGRAPGCSASKRVNAGNWRDLLGTDY